MAATHRRAAAHRGDADATLETAIVGRRPRSLSASTTSATRPAPTARSASTRSTTASGGRRLHLVRARPARWRQRRVRRWPDVRVGPVGPRRRRRRTAHPHRNLPRAVAPRPALHRRDRRIRARWNRRRWRQPLVRGPASSAQSRRRSQRELVGGAPATVFVDLGAVRGLGNRDSAWGTRDHGSRIAVGDAERLSRGRRGCRPPCGAPSSSRGQPAPRTAAAAPQPLCRLDSESAGARACS